ncbi:MAG TPA: flagellar biosynthesis protein FlhB [Alphaproteobacteria bacterium]
MAEGDEQDDSQKTEDPTAKKLEEARKRGQVPMSKEVNTWLMLVVSTVLIVAFAPIVMERLTFLLRVVLEQSWQLHSDTGLINVLAQLMFQVFAIIGMVLAILFLASGIGPFAQIGPLLSYETIKPKLDKLSPMAGFKRLFSKKSFFEFIKGLIKISIIGAVSVAILKPFFNGMEHFIELPLQGVMAEMMTIFIKLMIGILTVLAVLAGIDLLFQRYSHYQQMRMSRQEIKDEYKQTEGDPHVRSRLRQIRMERARNRMMQNVPTSTVVVTNPTHFAVALKYDPDSMDAPVCVAKGQDLIALRIRELANDNGVIIVENPPLARTLFKAVDIDEAIPPEHYKAVAEVISYVFRMQKKL